MSVQLVLFPQEAINSNEFIVDGLDFTSINASSSYGAATLGSYALSMSLNNAYPTLINTWYRYRSTLTGSPTLPAEISGNLILYTGGGLGYGSSSGVYQNINNLIAGQSYTLSVTITAPITAGTTLSLIVKNASNATLGSGNFGASDTTKTISFSAVSGDNIIAVQFLEPIFTNSVAIESISLTTYYPPDYTGQVICDLYEDEEIPLTLSVDNFKNVAEKIQSYSKDFNLPATKRNNKIFGNIFEITRTVANAYDFNPYVKTRAVLKQDGFILFDGALRLIDIQDKEGEISYNVNLYAQTIALADILKNRTFNNIDFSELEHAYTKVQIKGSWYTNGLPLSNPLPVGTYAGTAGASVTDVLKYPFVDWTHQILVANGATGSGATLGTPELTNLEQAFRPFIKIKYLLDRIFSDAGYTYSSSVFDSGKFKKLWMDFNWGGDRVPAVLDNTSYTATMYYLEAGVATFNTDQTFIRGGFIDNSVTGGQATSYVPPDYVNSGADIYKIVATTSNQLYNIDYQMNFYNDLSNNDDDFIVKWLKYDDSTGVTSTVNYQTVNIYQESWGTIKGSIEVALNLDDKLWWEYAGTGSFTGTWAEYRGGTATFTISSTVISSAALNNLRGELNQWDFLKGILTMFNLVTLQDKTDPANIIIEPYADVFITTTQGTSLAERSIQHDWTDKVDIKDIKLTPLNDLKKTTIFKYDEESDDYIFNVYKGSTRGHLYGSKVFSAEGLTLLEGDDEIVASPFAATVSKPLGQGFNEMIVPTVYSMNDDGTTNPFDNMPRILYNHTGASPVTMGSTTYYIPSQNGASSENSSLFFSFSHLSNIPTTATTDDYNFGECQYIQPIGQTVTSNLFNTYWLPYYNELYNPDTKTMVLKVNLQPADIATFEFSDYVMIKNRSYRVNRIDYKPKDLSTVEFILIP